ncbi:unnamed protein product, partial [Polarella glacialis]
ARSLRDGRQMSGSSGDRSGHQFQARGRGLRFPGPEEAVAEGDLDAASECSSVPTIPCHERPERPEDLPEFAEPCTPRSLPTASPSPPSTTAPGTPRIELRLPEVIGDGHSFEQGGRFDGQASCQSNEVSYWGAEIQPEAVMTGSTIREVNSPHRWSRDPDRSRYFASLLPS